MLTRRAAAKVAAGDHENLGVRVWLLVEHKVVVRLVCLHVVPQWPKQCRTETCTLDGFQELLGNNHVGVDIGALHGRSNAFEHTEGRHALSTRIRVFGRSSRSYGCVVHHGRRRRDDGCVQDAFLDKGAWILGCRVELRGGSWEAGQLSLHKLAHIG